MSKEERSFTIDASQIPPPSATLVKTVGEETRKLEYRLAAGGGYSVREIKDGAYIGRASLDERSAINRFIGYLRDGNVETPGLSNSKRREIAADLQCYLDKCRKAILDNVPGLKETFARNASMEGGLPALAISPDKGGIASGIS